MDQQYRDALNNQRDDEINQLCEAEAEREVKTIYDSAAEVRCCRSLDLSNACLTAAFAR